MALALLAVMIAGAASPAEARSLLAGGLAGNLDAAFGAGGVASLHALDPAKAAPLVAASARGLSIDGDGRIVLVGVANPRGAVPAPIGSGSQPFVVRLDPDGRADEPALQIADDPRYSMQISGTAFDGLGRAVVGLTSCDPTVSGVCWMNAFAMSRDGRGADEAFQSTDFFADGGEATWDLSRSSKMEAFGLVKIQSRLSADPPVLDTRFAALSSVGGDLKIVLLHRNGGVDSTLVRSRDLFEGLGVEALLGTDDHVADMDVAPDGKILIAVKAKTRRGEFVNAVIRYAGATQYNPLALDPSFGIQGVAPGEPTFEDWTIGAMAVDLDERVVLAINHRLNESVTVDGQHFPPEDWFWVGRMATSGGYDSSFRPPQRSGGPIMTPLVRHFRAKGVVIDKRGRIVVAGERRFPGQSAVSGAMLRLLPDGRIDTTFGDPLLETADPIEQVLIDRSGRILASMTGGGDAKVVRVLSDPVGAPRIDRIVCGDGELDQATEECDDGNKMPGDGCSATCTIEDIDADGDGILDAGDWCVNVAGAQDFLRKPAPRLTISGIDRAASSYGSISFSGKFKMPAGFQFAALDPSADADVDRGIQVLVTNHSGSQRWGAPLTGAYAGPGTVGWLRSEGKWTYFGRPDNVMGNGGVTRLTLVDRGNGRVRLRGIVRHAAPAFAIEPEDLPLRVTVILGRLGGASRRGECGEARFTGRDCEIDASGMMVSCKG